MSCMPSDIIPPSFPHYILHNTTQAYYITLDNFTGNFSMNLRSFAADYYDLCCTFWCVISVKDN